MTAGLVGVALQSGALASVVLAFAKAHAIGLSVLTTMGNEAMMTTADVLDYLVEDEATRVICLFLEEIGDPVGFARVAEKADRAGKPIVAMKVGSSPAGQEAALAHTGSVAGDDAVVDAALRQLNIIRVASLEELLITGAALGYNRWPRGRRMGVLTLFGGSCDIIADAASARGLVIPEFSPETAAAITAHLPPFAAAHNPLDVTGFGVLANLSGRMGFLTAADHALDIAVRDPNLDFVLFTGVTLPEARPPDEVTARTLEARVDWLARRMASAPIPVIPARVHLRKRQRLRPGPADAARYQLPRRAGPGDQRAGPRAALAGEPRPGPAGPGRPGGGLVRLTRSAGSGPWSEARARRLLAERGRAGGARRAGRLGRRSRRDRQEGRAAGGAEDLLGADHPQVGHRRGRPRAGRRRRRCGPATEKVLAPRARR